MKFLSLAVAAVVGMTEAKKTISSEQMKARMQKGQFNKRTLMRGAKPYGDTARKLEEAGEDAEAWQINGLYSVQFSQCLSMKVQDEDLFGENIISYAQEGSVVAEKSYIIFTACQSSDCYYAADDEKLTFVTDIASFFQAFADFLPNQVEMYCEGCNQNYDYCMGNLDAQQDGYVADDAAAQEENADEQDAEQQDEGAEEGDEQDAEQQDEGAEEGDEAEQQGEEGQDQEGEQQGEEGEGENNDGARKLSKVMNLPFRKLANNQVVQEIDCDMCNNYECFAEDGQEEQAEGDDVQYEFEDALQWLEGLSQCQQMEDNTYNDMALYSGLICNADGNGVEIGVFLDEDCTLYAKKLSFGSMMSYSDSMYFSMSEEVVEYMFTNDFSCYQPDVQYTNPYEYEDQQQEDANGDEEQQDPEAAEWCATLFNGNMEAVSLYDCGADQNGDNQDEQADEEDAYLSTYAWYSYQLTQNQMQDGAEVCQAIKSLNGEYSTLYDKSSGGTLYNYKKNWANTTKNGMRPGGVATLIIFIVLASAGAAAYFVKSKKGGDKRAPLLNAEGTMA